MLTKKSVEDINVTGKRVLVRCDFNVPMEDGRITDDNRIVGALPTIKYLLAHNARVILCSHMGRPKGEFNPKYTLAPVAKRLSELLGKDVTLAADVVGPDAQAKAAALKDGEVLLLENVRFHRRRRKTTPPSPSSLRLWRRFMSTTRSAPRTARTRPPRAWPTTCRRSAAT